MRFSIPRQSGLSLETRGGFSGRPQEGDESSSDGQNGPGGHLGQKPRKSSRPHPEALNRAVIRFGALSSSRSWRSPGPIQVWCTEQVTYIPMTIEGFSVPGDAEFMGPTGTARAAQDACPGGCRTRWSRPFVAKHSRKRSTGTIPRRSSIQTRGVSSPARSSRDYSKGPGCVSRWTGEAAGWTTSSSSVCGVHSNTNASI